MTYPATYPATYGLAFPDGSLGPKVEIDVGAWTDITSRVAIDDGGAAGAITITRGRADGSQQANPSTAVMKWNNVDGAMSPRNPLGPYYGSLGRNTAVRVSIPAVSTYLRTENDTSSVSAPDSAILSITGSIDIRIDLQLSGYGASALAHKYVRAGNQVSWAFCLEDNGMLSLTWSPDGTTTNAVKAFSTTAIPTPARQAVRVTLNTATGTVTFYTAPTISGTWTQLGATSTTGATSIFDSSSPVGLSYNADLAALGYTACQGRIYAFQLLSGIGGSTAASPDFTTATPGALSLTDLQGNVWTTSAAEFSGRDYRYHGQCAALPQEWDVTGLDAWTPVTAAGPLRRFNRNLSPLGSAMKRAVLAYNGTSAPIAYWPCEDAASATQLGSALPGGSAMGWTGNLTRAADSGFVCSKPVPTLNGAKVQGHVPASFGLHTAIRFLLHIPSGTTTAAGAEICEIRLSYQGSETIEVLKLLYQSGGALQAIALLEGGTTVLDTGNVAVGAAGELLLVSIELSSTGGGAPTGTLTLNTYSAGSTVPVSGTASTSFLAGDWAVTQVRFNRLSDITDATSFGHVAVFGPSAFPPASDFASPLSAWAGETAASRFARLCLEQGLRARIYGHPAASVRMGIQETKTIAELLQECEDSDQGMIYEARSTLAIGYRTSNSMSAQSSAVSLNYSQDNLSPPLTPTDDDQYTANNWSVTRTNGSGATAKLNDGSPMSISPPPIGVGDYQNSKSVSLFSDTQATDVANWLVHLGTVDEERYPAMNVDLATASLSSLFWPVAGTDCGDRVSVSNLPAFLPPDGIEALVWGATEVIADKVFRISWQTQPESPYEVLVADTSRADTGGATLSSAITSTATTMTVATATGSALWTTAAGDFPFDVILGGERITVTNITGTSSPQTFTIARSVNGIVKSHNSGEKISLFSPAYFALA